MDWVDRMNKAIDSTIEKYVKWDAADDLCIVEIWLPVALK